MMKTLLILFAGITLLLGCIVPQKSGQNGSVETIVLSKDELRDKIKGAWAGQTIGVTFGWPTEFKYQGTFIQDYQKIPWNADYVNQAMDEFPGLYDDIYVDLTFVDVIEKKGLSATPEDFGQAFALTEYDLWHANQAARHNLQQGMSATESGHWHNNPHADDIDFQIESDFIEIMSPGMPNVASEICDRVGHVMNYGDGWYGGVFVSNLYSQAFVTNDIHKIIELALSVIPEQSTFYRCVRDVMQWYHDYPDDWHRTWFELQRNWAEDVGCPSMVLHPLNIDAKLNAAYVVMGLLYGEGDFTKSMEIATRVGQDSDCNPAVVAGIFGTINGYESIPDYWLEPLKKAEHRNFSHSDYSLNRTYEVSYNHALENILQNGGSIDGDKVTIPYHHPEKVRFEQGFTGHYPIEKKPVRQIFDDETEVEVKGIGFVIEGYVRKTDKNAEPHTLEAALYVDDKRVETARFPTSINERRLELFWKYELADQTHKVRVEILNPKAGYDLYWHSTLIYGSEPVEGIRTHN